MLFGDLPGLAGCCGEAVTRHRNARAPTIWRDSNSKNLMRRGTLADRVPSRLPRRAPRPFSSRSSLSPSLRRPPRRRSWTSRSTPEGGVDFGEAHAVTGKLTGPYGAPLVGPPGRARDPAATRTAAGYVPVRRTAFDRPRRPLRLRAGVRPQPPGARASRPSSGTAAPSSAIYVFPRTSLSFALVRRDVIRVVQTYRTPSERQARPRRRSSTSAGRAGRRRAAGRASRHARVERRRPKRVKGPLPRHRAGAASRAAWERALPLRELLPVQRGHGQPEAGLPEEALQASSERPREQVGERRVQRRRDRPVVAVREPAQLEHDARVVGGDDDLAAVGGQPPAQGGQLDERLASRSGARRRGRRRTRARRRPPRAPPGRRPRGRR